MFERVVFPLLKDHLSRPQVTVITGMRRVGKSTALRYLLQHVNHNNKLYLDCERVEIRTLLNRPDYESISEELQLGGLDFSKPCVIALDEIQLVENLPSLVKYLYDTYQIKFLVSGSSSYYLKNRFSESLAGRKRIFELYPLNFKEFLTFKGHTPLHPERHAWKSFDSAWHNSNKKWYEEYLRYGGFPEVTLTKKFSDKEELLKDIINSYIELDVKLLSDYSASEELYKLIKLLAVRTGSKVDFTKISSVAGINRQKVSAYIQLMEYTYLIYLVSPFSRNTDREISQQPKIYFADTGLLRALAGEDISGGQIFENAVAAQLIPLGELNYYQKKTGQEIDFILNKEKAIEVKETPTLHDVEALRQRSSSIHLKKSVLISRHFPKNKFQDFVWGGCVF